MDQRKFLDPSFKGRSRDVFIGGDLKVKIKTGEPVYPNTLTYLYKSEMYVMYNILF